MPRKVIKTIDTTSIGVSKLTWKALNVMKNSGESMDDVIQRLLIIAKNKGE